MINCMQVKSYKHLLTEEKFVSLTQITLTTEVIVGKNTYSSHAQERCKDKEKKAREQKGTWIKSVLTVDLSLDVGRN